MAGPMFDIYFSGKVMEGQDPALVRQKVGILFKAKEAQLNALFSGSPVRVKAGVDQDAAVKYRVAFRNAGALLEIRPAAAAAAPPPSPAAEPSTPPSPPAERPAPVERPAAPPTPPSPPVERAAPVERPAPAAPPAAARTVVGAGGALSLLPPRSGSLIDCAVEEVPAELPDIRDLAMANRGAALDESPPEPPLELDLSGLKVLPPNTGSLADCVIPEKPVKIPDISRLQVVEPTEPARRTAIEFED
jgi:hypothetical protein